MKNFINELLVGIYVYNRDGKQYYSNSNVLTISKVKMSILFIAWTGVIVTLIGRYVIKQHIIIPANLTTSALVILFYYFIIKTFTWDLDTVIKYIEEKDDPFLFKKRYRQFNYLTLIGGALAGFIAYHNIWNLNN